MDQSITNTANGSTLIKNGVVVTVNATNEIFDPGFVLVEGNRITAVGPMAAAPPDHSGRVMDAHTCLVMPGLINVHTHAAMSLLRGVADDLPLKTWLEQYIFPIESRLVTPDFVYTGTLLAGLEMIRSGTTCFCDGYFFEESALHAVAQIGLRAVLGQAILDAPTPDVPDPSRNIAYGREFLECCAAASELITGTLFCHAAYTCGPPTLGAASALCQEYGVPLLIHTAETTTEVSEVVRQYGRSPLRHLDSLGLLDHPVVLKHCVWVDADEYVLLKRDTVGVAHCPESNMKLASGVAPVAEYLEQGIAVGLGTDGCASNNDLDMFGEMDTAAKIHKVKRCNPAVMNACE
ncbi:MAG TPA: amidohydrolase, partial [Thermodesulfobacteriota bacterium]|nr:amidohydrolase [Thermodesulfobacteriota bacterium]